MASAKQVSASTPGQTTGGTAASSAAPRLNGLDGLRAIAVTAVILYHGELRWARGGYLGVDLFFVISGFLITHLLAREFERTGGVNLAGFYWRRAKRLLPASWLMTAVAIVAACVVAPDALSRLRPDALASLFYVTNWELLTAKVSYFDSLGRQPLLLHLWSLAIEEQFYILWAPLLMLGLARAGRARMALFTLAAIVLMLAWTALIANRGGYLMGATATRLDFGADTHSYPLLIGALLGLLWRPGDTIGDGDDRGGHGVFTLGLIALGVLIALFCRLSEETPQLYPWGFLAAASASAGVIAAATFPGSYFGRWLDQQPLRWVGERSYGLYLWHWPIFMLLRPEDVALDDRIVLALRLCLTVAAATISYRYLETPIRRGLLDRILGGMVTPGRRLASVAAAIGVVLVVGALLAPLALLWKVDPARLNAMSAAYTARHPYGRVRTGAGAATAVRAAVAAAPTVYAGPQVTAVGDSVLLGSADALRQSLTGAQVYAHVGWQARDVIETLRQLKAANALTPVVVVHLGTNGYVYEPQLREILSLLADRDRVILINSHVPRRWMEPNNALFDRVAPAFGNVVLVDWRRTSEGQDAFFVADGFHLTPTGQSALIGEIMRVGHLASAAPALSPGEVTRVRLTAPRARKALPALTAAAALGPPPPDTPAAPDAR